MSSITIDLDENLFKIVKRRAKRNLFSVKKQIEDIVRRSMLSYKDSGSSSRTKVDDTLVNIFSREKRGRKKQKNRKNK